MALLEEKSFDLNLLNVKERILSCSKLTNSSFTLDALQIVKLMT